MDEIGPDSQIELVKTVRGYAKLRRSYKVNTGGMLASANVEVTAGQARATTVAASGGSSSGMCAIVPGEGPSGRFVITYDPARDVADVVGVTGRTEVRNPSVGEPVVLETQYHTRVQFGQPPTQPDRLTEEEFLTYLRPYTLIGGGGAESQAIDHPLLTRGEVPQGERPPVSAPAGVPGDVTRRDRAGEPANLIPAPFPANTTTDLGIGFGSAQGALAPNRRKGGRAGP